MKPAIKKEISRARWLYDRYGEALLKEHQIAELLARYRKTIASTQEKMRRIGVTAACTACALEMNECCCFEGAAEKYDHILLLINLLLGVELPDVREIPGDCLFVGPKGCKVLARHYFCVNYLCLELKDSLSPSDCEEYKAVVNEELNCGWETEQAVRQWLGQHAETDT